VFALQFGHSILIISLKCLSIMSIFFSCNSFLCFSFEAENANHKVAIVIAMNIIEIIRIISPAIDVAISFIPHRRAAFFSNY